MSDEAERRGSLEVALERTAELLDIDVTMAVEQAKEILIAVPNHPPALLLQAMAYRRMAQPEAALEILEPLLNAQHKWAAAWFERGASLTLLGRGDEAIEALLKAVEYQPEHPEAWRQLADHLMATGDTEGADAAYARHVKCTTRDPALQEAAAAMVKKDVATAERLLKRYLMGKPTDVAAIRMLAEVAVRCDRDGDAEKLLQRCLELAPGFVAARYNYALLLQRRNRAPEALAEVEICLQHDPKRPNYRNLCAVVLGAVGEYKRASEMYEQLLAEYPKNPKVWLSYGHVLKTQGRQDDCVAAYRESLARNPSFGDAYWSLANLKTFRFSESDLSAMRESLADPELSDTDRWHLHFALGKAAEDAGDYALSFEHYAEGNRLYRARYGYNAEVHKARRDALMWNFSREFFEARRDFGHPAPDPIFIVGMPRSGSTLLEQILACHSQVEGTMELPDMITMALELREEATAAGFDSHAELLASKSADEIRALGEQYLTRTRVHRKTDRPFFIDKMPNNFLHAGMIHLLLPNAKIIDARRHPMGCCFSNFKQFYASGQIFSYDLADLGRHYRNYVILMRHFDEVLPGRIHRVFYEDTVADTEKVVRELLEYCELEYEPECLRFFDSQRPVRTASSEQVRQPINQKGIEQWQHFERWLEPLKNELGDVLDLYPEVPASQ